MGSTNIRRNGTMGSGKHFILVLDDLQQVCQKDKEVAEMFPVGSHHFNLV